MAWAKVQLNPCNDQLGYNGMVSLIPKITLKGTAEISMLKGLPDESIDASKCLSK